MTTGYLYVSKRAALEVKYQIPVELLGLLGTPEELTAVIDTHVKTTCDIAGSKVPRSWEPKIYRYTIYRVKQAIFERTEALGVDWKPSQPFIGELVSDYKDAALVAEDLLEAIKMLTVFRQRANILGAAS